MKRVSIVILMMFCACVAFGQNGPTLPGGSSSGGGGGGGDGVKPDFSNVNDGAIPTSKLQASGTIQPDAVSVSEGTLGNLSLKFKDSNTGWYLDSGESVYVVDGKEELRFAPGKLIASSSSYEAPFYILTNSNDGALTLGGGTGAAQSQGANITLHGATGVYNGAISIKSGSTGNINFSAGTKTFMLASNGALMLPYLYEPPDFVVPGMIYYDYDSGNLRLGTDDGWRDFALDAGGGGQSLNWKIGNNSMRAMAEIYLDTGDDVSLSTLIGLSEWNTATGELSVIPIYSGPMIKAYLSGQSQIDVIYAKDAVTSDENSKLCVYWDAGSSDYYLKNNSSVNTFVVEYTGVR